MVKKLVLFITGQKSAVTYTSGSIFNSIAQVISSVIILAYLSPDDLGIWNSILLFQTYSMFLQAGIINGLNRELPFYLGKKENAFAKELASNALYIFIWSSILCAIIGAGLLLYYNEQKFIFKITYIGIILITVSKFYENYLTTTFRSNNAFEQLGKVYFFRGFYLILSTIIVIFFGYYGYIVRMVSISFLFSFLMHLIRPLKVKPKFNFNNTKLLFKVGAPIFILAYIFSSSATFDRLILVNYAGFTTVGHYSLALMAYSALSMLPISLANYIYPKMSYKFGETNDVSKLMSIAIKVNIIVFIIMLPIAVLGFFLIPVVVPILFPEYVLGMRSAQILLFASVFFGGTIGNNVFWSLKLWKYITISQLGGTILNIFVIYLGFVLIDDSIIGISLGVVFSQLCYMLLNNSLIYLSLKNEKYTK